MAGPSFRFSIRYKVVGLVSLVVLMTLGAYLALATELYRRDKTAYIFELSSAVTTTVAQELGSHLEFLAEQVERVGERVLATRDPAERKKLLEAFLAEETDFVGIRVLRLNAEGKPELVASHLDPERLQDMSIGVAELESDRSARAIPFGELGNLRVWVENGSIPPDAALLRMAVPVPDPAGGVRAFLVTELRQERFLRILGQSSAQITYMVGSDGTVLAHPLAEYVVNRRSFGERPIVRAALEGEFERGVRTFQDDQGETFLGAFAAIEGIGGAIVAETPRSTAMKAARDLVWSSMAFGVALILLAVIVSVIFSRRLTAPLRELEIMTGAIGEGDFDIQVKARSNDEIGRLAEAFGTMTEALKVTQSQLVQSEKMAAFGQLGAGVTHEVKNPLAGVLGYIQIALDRAKDDPKQSEILERAQASVRRCVKILDNFLRFARVDAGGLAAADLGAAVEEGVSLARHQLEMKNVQLECDVGDQPVSVLLAEGQIQQVILNLLLNAMHAMPEGGKVSVGLESSKGHAVIRVKDDGPGIPSEVQGRIFEPFFTTKPAGEGTGLGLAVSYGIVQAHRGEIGVSSSPKGTTFTIRLPLAEAAAAAKA